MFSELFVDPVSGTTLTFPFWPLETDHIFTLSHSGHPFYALFDPCAASCKMMSGPPYFSSGYSFEDPVDNSDFTACWEPSKHSGGEFARLARTLEDRWFDILEDMLDPSPHGLAAPEVFLILEKDGLRFSLYRPRCFDSGVGVVRDLSDGSIRYMELSPDSPPRSGTYPDPNEVVYDFDNLPSSIPGVPNRLILDGQYLLSDLCLHGLTYSTHNQLESPAS